MMNKPEGFMMIEQLEESVGIRTEDKLALKAAYKHESVLEREIWNKAIEAAAAIMDNETDRANVRSLKKRIAKNKHLKT